MAQGRAKRPHQKVKTGCLTCRKRRIKCDEGKPSCRQCIDSLRKCEGYQPPQTWLFKPRRNVQKLDHQSLLQIVSPLGPMGDADDRRMFQFWNEQSAPIFSCYFAHSFWTELLPQIGLVQPAVKHMLLATSSVVEFAALDGIPLDQNPGYQLHYTKAIQATCASPQVENVLMACLLFACCDFMRGSVVSGLRHIHAGLNIIDEWCKTSKDPDSKTSPTARLIVGAIGPIFVSYFDKAPTYGMGDVTLARSAYCAPITPVVELPYIGVFTHLHRVHHALDGIAHHIARMMDWRTKPWIPSPPAEIQSLLDSWRVSFDDFKANLSESRKELYARSLQILQIHSTALSVMLRASSGDTESIYEQFEEEFMWIVDKYDDFAAMWAQDESAKFFAGCANNLDCHMGFIPPLFLTATKCRNPATRMAALNHLAALEVEENNWTSCTAYVIARKIIEVETRRSIINNRVGMRDEQDLIRPVKAFLTDKRTTQGGLDYAEFPYEGESTPVLCETLDLMDCSSLGSNCSSGQWPLSRILRIGGYQGGAVKPIPAKCSCSFHSPKEELVLLPKE